ncbi:MAG: chemotaxis protein CheB, partial [Planctomycetes bacterium]|nr:chemotaxis protein CheB [Planctomycetota bacterium]
FLEGMIEWLGKTTVLPIQIATHGGYLLPGHIYFAPDNFHLGVRSDGRMELSNDALENYVRPSVSYLFRSISHVYGKGAIGVLLTGMGRDGAYEMGQMKRNGAVTITQDKESCVVYGMPYEAVKLGAATHALPLEKIPVMLEELVKEKERE